MDPLRAPPLLTHNLEPIHVPAMDDLRRVHLGLSASARLSHPPPQKSGRPSNLHYMNPQSDAMGDDPGLHASPLPEVGDALPPIPIPDPVDNTLPQRTETVRPSTLTLTDVEGLLRALGQDTNASFIARTGYRKNRFREFPKPRDVHRLLEPEGIEDFSASPAYNDGSELNFRVGKYGVQFATAKNEDGEETLSNKAINNALLHLQQRGIKGSSRALGVIGMLTTLAIGFLSMLVLATQLDQWFDLYNNTEMIASIAILGYPTMSAFFRFQGSAIGINERWLDTTVPNGASDRSRRAKIGRIT